MRRWVSRKVVITAATTAAVVTLALNFTTPEKQMERRIEHRFAVADPQFRREMSVLLGPSILPGNHVTALQNGDEVFPAMLEAIRGAQVSITFETYIYWSGEIGAAFSDALSERARAGIPVAVIIDWLGSVKMDSELLQRMEESGVRLKRYRPLHWYHISRMNNRTHRKILVVDGRVAFTGGVGVADHWMGNAQDPEHWRDAHFRVEGPAVAQFQAAFNDNWIKTTGEILAGEAYFPPLAPVGSMDAQLFIASPTSGSESMHLMYLMSIAGAAHTIDLAASYFVPDDLLLSSIVAARKRGVRVRLLVPGKHLDAETVRIAAKGEWGPLLREGVEVYEYQPTMMHTKMLIVDTLLVSVGSTNFDIRSFRLNDESSLNVYDRGFAQAMTEVFERDLVPTVRYTQAMFESRPLKEKLMEKLLLPLKSQL